MTLRSGRLDGGRLLAGLLLATTLAAAGCAPVPGAAAEPTGSSGPAAADPSADADAPAPAAPVGRPAPSSRVRFVPERVVLAGGAAAPVQPAVTRDGELKVPEDVAHVGWWDGSAYAGDPFGHTVIAGHVDSASEGLGFFSRLLDARRGETVTLHGGGHTLAYRIARVQTIRKDALAADSSTFAQDGAPRLVLITCGGRYLRGHGGYDSNVVVTAVPLGLAR